MSEREIRGKWPEVTRRVRQYGQFKFSFLEKEMKLKIHWSTIKRSVFS